MTGACRLAPSGCAAWRLAKIAERSLELPVVRCADNLGLDRGRIGLGLGGGALFRLIVGLDLAQQRPGVTEGAGQGALVRHKGSGDLLLFGGFDDDIRRNALAL